MRVRDMSVIQISNVPAPLYRALKSRAAMAGISLSDYVLGELKRLTDRPTTAELRRRLAQREPVQLDVSPGQAIADERQSF